MVTKLFARWIVAYLTVGACLSISVAFADSDEIHGPPIQIINSTTDQQVSTVVNNSLPEALTDEQAGSFANLAYQSTRLKVSCWGSSSCGLGYEKNFAIKNYFHNKWGHDFGVMPGSNYSSEVFKIPHYQDASYFRPNGRASLADSRNRSLYFYSRDGERDRGRHRGFLYTSGKSYANFSGDFGRRYRVGPATKAPPATDTEHPIIGLIVLSLLFGLVLTKEIATQVFRNVKR